MNKNHMLYPSISIQIRFKISFSIIMMWCRRADTIKCSQNYWKNYWQKIGISWRFCTELFVRPTINPENRALFIMGWVSTYIQPDWFLCSISIARFTLRTHAYWKIILWVVYRINKGHTCRASTGQYVLCSLTYIRFDPCSTDILVINRMTKMPFFYCTNSSYSQLSTVI